MTYFEFFDIPLAFDIDLKSLRTVYLENSRKFHPDFALANGLDLDEALVKSSLNNKAYKTLISAELCRAYILEIKGLLGAEKEQLPMEFLMEMMDLNERVADLQLEHSSGQVEEVLNAQEELQKSVLISLERAEKEFDKAQEISALEKVKEFHLKHKYILRIKESIDTFAAL
jgi:molecular chaperone HscB